MSAPFAGAEVVRHYGDPEAEYRAVRESAGLVLRADLGIMRMHGRDPRRMLNGLITNDLALAGPERAIYAAMLTPKGRMITDLRALLDGEELVFDFPRAAEGPLVEHLKKYVPPLFARWEVAPSAVVVGVYGPRSAELLRRFAADLPTDAAEDSVTAIEIGGVRAFAVATPFAGGEPGWDVLVPGSGGEGAWEALLQGAGSVGGRPIGFAALETLRIEAGRPRFGREMAEEALPAEVYESTGLMDRAVSFTKGCYTGQEVVVRIAHRGHVNRHLRGVLLGDAPSPAEGTTVVRPSDGKEIGKITSAAYSPLIGQTVALAIVRREVLPAETVRVGEGGAEGTIAELPFVPAR